MIQKQVQQNKIKLIINMLIKYLINVPEIMIFLTIFYHFDYIIIGKKM